MSSRKRVPDLAKQCKSLPITSTTRSGDLESLLKEITNGATVEAPVRETKKHKKRIQSIPSSSSSPVPHAPPPTKKKKKGNRPPGRPKKEKTSAEEFQQPTEKGGTGDDDDDNQSVVDQIECELISEGTVLTDEQKQQAIQDLKSIEPTDQRETLSASKLLSGDIPSIPFEFKLKVALDTKKMEAACGVKTERSDTGYFVPLEIEGPPSQPQPQPQLAIENGSSSGGSMSKSLVVRSTDPAKMQLIVSGGGIGDGTMVVGGKRVVVKEAKDLVTGELIVGTHNCEQGKCTYVNIVDVIDDEDQIDGIVKQLREKRIIGLGGVDGGDDPSVYDIFVCAESGTYHDCRPHTCFSTVQSDGSYVCWKTGRIHGKIYSSVDVDRFSFGGGRTSGDGTELRMSGYSAKALTDAQITMEQDAMRRNVEAKRAGTFTPNQGTKAPIREALVKAVRALKRDDYKPKFPCARQLTGVGKKLVSEAVTKLDAECAASSFTKKKKKKRDAVETESGADDDDDNDDSLPEDHTQQHKVSVREKFSEWDDWTSQPEVPTILTAVTTTTTTTTTTTIALPTTLLVNQQAPPPPPQPQQPTPYQEAQQRRQRLQVLATEKKRETENVVVGDIWKEKYEFLNSIIDREWLNKVHEMFGKIVLVNCPAYDVMLGDKDPIIDGMSAEERTMMAKKINMVAQDVAVSLEVSKYMLVTLPMIDIERQQACELSGVPVLTNKGGRGSRGRGRSSSSSSCFRGESGLSATLASSCRGTQTVGDATNGSSAAVIVGRGGNEFGSRSSILACANRISAKQYTSKEWCDSIRNMYASFIARCWILIRASQGVVRETTIMIAEMTQKLNGRRLEAKGAKPPQQQQQQQIAEYPPLPALPNFAQCASGVLYLTFTGYEVSADFTDTQLPRIVQDRLKEILGEEVFTTFPQNHKHSFVARDSLAETKLVAETRLTKLCSHKQQHKGKTICEAPIKLDCQTVTSGRSAVQSKLCDIATWSIVKLAHDIIMNEIDAKVAIANFDKRVRTLALNTSF
jgi:hypothetical protein